MSPTTLCPSNLWDVFPASFSITKSLCDMTFSKRSQAFFCLFNLFSVYYCVSGCVYSYAHLMFSQWIHEVNNQQSSIMHLSWVWSSTLCLTFFLGGSWGALNLSLYLKSVPFSGQYCNTSHVSARKKGDTRHIWATIGFNITQK